MSWIQEHANGENRKWETDNAKVFGARLLFHLYMKMKTTMLEDYVSGGIRSSESVLAIATNAHINTLNVKLRTQVLTRFILHLKDLYTLMRNKCFRFLVNECLMNAFPWR